MSKRCSGVKQAAVGRRAQEAARCRPDRAGARTAISLLAAPVCLAYSRGAGAEMSGHRRREAMEGESAT